MTADEVAVLLLAGGRSERFGPEDKLQADLNGMPLGLHTIHKINDLPWKRKIAVHSGALAPSLSALGYTVIPAVEREGMGDNLAKGVRTLDKEGAVLVVLGDMPFVTLEHIETMLTAAKRDDFIIASGSGGHMSPPVLFSRALFRDLERLSGDVGARAMLNARWDQVTLIEAATGELHDIDTPQDWRVIGATR